MEPRASNLNAVAGRRFSAPNRSVSITSSSSEEPVETTGFPWDKFSTGMLLGARAAPTGPPPPNPGDYTETVFLTFFLPFLAVNTKFPFASIETAIFVKAGF